MIFPEIKSGEILKFGYSGRRMERILYSVNPLSFDTMFLIDRDGHMTKILWPLFARIVASRYVKIAAPLTSG